MVSTSTRNFPNRLGDGADVFLASAELSAIASVIGRLPTVEEYHKYITLSSHLYGTSILLCNKKKYYSWDKPFQDNLITLIKRATVYQRQLAINEDEKCMKYLKMNGTKIMKLDKILRDEMKLKCLDAGLNVIEKFPDHIRKIL